MLPFTVDQFLDVFERYNVAVWPSQLPLYALAVWSVALALQRKGFSKSISFVLSVFWIWMGLAYHWRFFTTINKAAFVFAAVFVLQGILFLIAGVWTQQLKFRFTLDFYGIVGGVFLLYALIVYPALGYWLNHRYPAAPTFGLPCPTTIFTFGILLWTKLRVPRYLLVIPLAWSLVGFWAAVSLGMNEDLGLLGAGVVGSLLIILRDHICARKASRNPSDQAARYALSFD